MPAAPILKVNAIRQPNGIPIAQYAAAMYKVGIRTSLMPLSKPAPIACVASEIWKTAAYNINIADKDKTAALPVKARGKIFLRQTKDIAPKIPYNRPLSNVLFPILLISFQLFLPQALLTLIEPPCDKPHETINATDAQLIAI